MTENKKWYGVAIDDPGVSPEHMEFIGNDVIDAQSAASRYAAADPHGNPWFVYEVTMKPMFKAQTVKTTLTEVIP